MGVDPRAWLAELRADGRLREHAGLRRRLVPRDRTDSMIDMAGNDYLGLARHPRVVEAGIEALRAYGLGATGSRLVRGTTDIHATLEAELALWLGTEAALVYSSGYLANIGAVRALAGPDTAIVSDAHNHASLVDGCRASRSRVVVTPHADVAAIEGALATAGPNALVVTESVFSVNGDLAPLADLHRTTRRYGARLLVDDAHGVGLLGQYGAGGVAAAGLAGQPDVIVTATLSKTFGGAGGVVAGPKELIEALVETGRTFIYDTGLPPAVAAGCLAALDVIRRAEDLRAEVRARATALATALTEAGLPVWPPAAGVLSVGAPSSEAALAWADACRERGVAVGCFRPPSTPDGSSRLRLTINAGVSRAAFEQAVERILATAPDRTHAAEPTAPQKTAATTTTAPDTTEVAMR
jgi:8-amino-7-oxononanoate synthase